MRFPRLPEGQERSIFQKTQKTLNLRLFQHFGEWCIVLLEEFGVNCLIKDGLAANQSMWYHKPRYDTKVLWFAARPSLNLPFAKFFNIFKVFSTTSRICLFFVAISTIKNVPYGFV